MYVNYVQCFMFKTYFLNKNFENNVLNEETKNEIKISVCVISGTSLGTLEVFGT